MNPIHLSIVIPAYNEERRIPSTLRAIATYLASVSYTSEIIVVLNNCTDGTLRVVQDLQKEIPGLEYIDLGMIAHPSGTKGLAVEKGMCAARGAYRIYIDADNAAHITEIEKLWPVVLGGADGAFGSRYLHGSKAHVSWYRRVLSRLANIAVQLILLPGVQDTQCAFKLFTARAADDIFSRTRVAGWGFDMEALYIARRLGYVLKEVPIVWDEVGGSSVKPKAFITAFIDLLGIRFRTKTF